MSRRWTKYDAPYGRCNKCGWAGCDWAFKYQGLCSKCYRQWKKEKREAYRRQKPPNDNLEITDGVVVTRNVQKRLLKQSQSDIPPVKHYELMESVAIIAPLIVIVLVICYFSTSNPLFFSVGVPIVVVISVLISRRENRRLNERMELVNTHVEDLAIDRKARIEEVKQFYSSAEWRLVRTRVIKQQGKVCQECGKSIKDDFDVTVDHIKPRSIYPDKALELENLCVLCRSCNSKKGDTDSEIYANRTD